MSCESGTKNLFLQSPLYYFSNHGGNSGKKENPGGKYLGLESLMDLLPGEISITREYLGDMFKSFMEKDVLFYFKADSKIGKLKALPADFFTEGFFCGTALLGEREYNIENPDLIIKKGSVYEFLPGEYLVTQGAGFDPEIIRTAGYNLWLDSIWECKKLCQNGYYLRLLGEKGSALFQVIWPVK